MDARSVAQPHVSRPRGKPLPVSILLADDHAAFRRALRRLLELDERIRVVGEAWDGESCVALAAQLRPDVVLMDVSMPGMGGVEATRRVLARAPDVHVIGLTLHDDPTHEAALRSAGARCLVSKRRDIEAVWAAILAWNGQPSPEPGSEDARISGGGAAAGDE